MILISHVDFNALFGMRKINSCILQKSEKKMKKTLLISMFFLIGTAHAMEQNENKRREFFDSLRQKCKNKKENNANMAQPEQYQQESKLEEEKEKLEIETKIILIPKLALASIKNDLRKNRAITQNQLEHYKKYIQARARSQAKTPLKSKSDPHQGSCENTFVLYYKSGTDKNYDCLSEANQKIIDDIIEQHFPNNEENIFLAAANEDNLREKILASIVDDLRAEKYLELKKIYF